MPACTPESWLQPIAGWGKRVNVKALIKRVEWKPERVNREVATRTRRTMTEMGRRIRRHAQLSMVFASGPSAPGTPPHAHKGRLRDVVLYHYDPRERKVTTGTTPQSTSGTSPSLPELHEYGGRTMRTVRVRGKVRRVRVTYPRRPYLAPALEAEAPRLPDVWRKSVR